VERLLAVGCVAVALAHLSSARGSSAALELALRRRVRGPHGLFVIRHERVAWDPRATALIVCDMWDKHWCRGAMARVAEMAPRANRFISEARRRGVLVVHAPSECMAAYQNHPARMRAIRAPRAANLPEWIARWAKPLASEKDQPWPIDQSDGGCDDAPPCKQARPWRIQHPAIEIKPQDAISDSGVEIWNLLEQRGIRNVIILGVHTNMCVIGRPFGLRNMVRAGKRVALVRDLTDTMYNSRRWPFVNHFRGTDLVVEHIEKFVCPTFTSDQVLGGEPFAFEADRRPRLLFVIAEKEYHTAETLPRYARAVWAETFGCPVAILEADRKDRNRIPGLAEALGRADVVVLSVRRRALPARDLAALRSYLAAGKPLVGIRTASHAFDTRGAHPRGHAEWREFGREVLGCNYHGHHGAGPKTKVTTARGAKDHPVLAGVSVPFEASGSLYKSSPLARSATPLLMGSIPGKKPEPVAWVNAYRGGRVFYTSLGHPKDFDSPSFLRLLTNGILWASGQQAAGSPPER